MGNDPFVDAAESASFPLPGTGKREGDEKMQPLQHFPSHLGRGISFEVDLRPRPYFPPLQVLEGKCPLDFLVKMAAFYTNAAAVGLYLYLLGRERTSSRRRALHRHCHPRSNESQKGMRCWLLSLLDRATGGGSKNMHNSQ